MSPKFLGDVGLHRGALAAWDTEAAVKFSNIRLCAIVVAAEFMARFSCFERKYSSSTAAKKKKRVQELGMRQQRAR